MPHGLRLRRQEPSHTCWQSPSRRLQLVLRIMCIQDPLRPKVAPAIARCYRAGIDVRMVTGANLATAIAIAKRTGILRENLHCYQNSKALSKRAMEGKVFRRVVHGYNNLGEATFNQGKSDAVWP